MALYQSIIRDDLQIPDEFLQEHASRITTKLKHALSELGQPNGKIFTINQCLHLASSIVLRHPRYLEETLNKLRRTQGLESNDPTTVVTVAALYHLLDTQVKEAWVEQLSTCFDEINWLLGRDAMRTLGFIG